MGSAADISENEDTGAEHLDMVIIGAGISGIGAAWYLRAPAARQDVRDPGEPREQRRHVGPVPLPRHPLGLGPAHLRLRLQAVGEREVDRGRPGDPRLHPRDRERERDRPHIRFGHRVVRASWSSEEALLDVEAQRSDTGETVTLKCSWLFGAAGYYRYEQGYLPTSRASSAFRAR